MLDVSTTGCAIYVGKRAFGPPRIECQNALLCFVLARMPRCDVPQVDGENVGD
jgi:hypothetical protein